MADVVASRVSVRDLKTTSPRGLARAQGSEVVEVTSHRKPIARISGLLISDPTTPADPQQNAINAGMITWSGQKPVFPQPVKLLGAGRLVSDIVIEDHLGGSQGRDGLQPTGRSVQR